MKIKNLPDIAIINLPDDGIHCHLTFHMLRQRLASDEWQKTRRNHPQLERSIMFFASGAMPI